MREIIARYRWIVDRRRKEKRSSVVHWYPTIESRSLVSRPIAWSIGAYTYVCAPDIGSRWSLRKKLDREPWSIGSSNILPYCWLNPSWRRERARPAIFITRFNLTAIASTGDRWRFYIPPRVTKDRTEKSRGRAILFGYNRVSIRLRMVSHENKNRNALYYIILRSKLLLFLFYYSFRLKDRKKSKKNIELIKKASFCSRY